MLTIYRGISGPGYVNPEKGWCFYGSKPDTLRKFGAAVSNYSEQQTDSYMHSSDCPSKRSVPGLPVMLSFDEARSWIEGKNYISRVGGIAAVAEVNIPEEMILDRSLTIWRNRGSNVDSDDFLLTAEMLASHTLGKAPIKGECYVPQYPVEALLPHTKIWTPASYSLDGIPVGEMVPLD